MEKEDKRILIISIIIAVALFGIVSWRSNFKPLIMGYVGIVSLMIIIFPYSIAIYLKVNKARKMEESFPRFLRDIAEAKRAGMTIPKAIELSAETDYGPLTKEIKQLRNQLSWGVPFPEAMKMLAERIKYSTYIRRGLAILLEAYYAGGKIADTMEAVSESTRELKEVEKQRESILQQQLLIIYLIHFIFIGILVALYRILIPLLSFQGTGDTSLISSFGGGESPGVEFYKLLFFLTMTIQSISNGLVAGVTKEGHITAGIKHAGIMLVISLLTYIAFIFPPMFSVNVISSKAELTTNEPIEFYGSVTLENKPVAGAKVTVNFGGTIKSEVTDEYGDFSIKLRSPTVSGDYTVVVNAEYENLKTKNRVSVKVK